MPDDSPGSATVARFGAKRLVVAADARARAGGVLPGMAVSHAQTLLPELAIAPADPAADATGLHALAVWCLRRYSPVVAIDAPDGLWIDMTGCTHFWPDEAALLADMAARLAARGVGARAAIAATPGAAHALARHAEVRLSVLDGGLPTLPSALAGLPATALRLDQDSLAVLGRLGFDTIGQIAAAARAPLARRLGRQVLARLDQAFGRADETLAPISPPRMVDAECRFAEPVYTPAGMARATGLLVEALCERLTRDGLGASRLDLACQRVDGQVQVLRISTAASSRAPAHLTRLLQERLEGIDAGFGIEHMRLSAPLVDRLDARQLVAGFDAPPETDLSGLVDTLMNRLGASRLYRVAAVDSDVPERSTRRIPPLAPAAPWNLTRSWPRPARLLTPPQEVQVMALLPDYPPARFTWRRRQHRVMRADGPERIFGEWWKRDGEANAVRDYFQVEDEEGARFWLFRRGDGIDPETGDHRWFVHGVFG